MVRSQLRGRSGSVVAAAVISAAASVSQGQVRAFPEAEGFGAFATGARGTPAIYHVTNLSNSGTGSFRDAVSVANRIVVFDVGGTVVATSSIAAKSNITILGQTAPGGGISIQGYELAFASQTNDICRYLRLRPGDTAPTSEDCLSLYNASNVIIDHTSMEFGPWNNIDAVTDTGNPAYVTIQNSLIADPINQQFAAHTEGTKANFTWSNNIIASSHNRMPLAKANTIFKNNVVYNYGGGYTAGNTGTPFSHDFVGNVFVNGPAGGTAYYQIPSNQSFYSAGNVVDSNKDGVLNGSTTSPSGVTALSQPFSSYTAGLPTVSITDSYNFAIQQAGASNVRDQLDSLVISQVQTLGLGTSGTASGTTGPDGGMYHHAYNTGLTNGGLGITASGSRPAGWDTDSDGIPDTWETAHGLDPNNPADSLYANPVGYRMIEVYADDIVTTNGTKTMNASGAWATAASWSTGVLPIALDYAEIRGSGVANSAVTFSSGTSMVEKLFVGGGGPAAGETLAVSGDTFAVYDTLTVGDQGNATVTVTGGTLAVWNMVLGNGSNVGTFNLTAGTFSAGGVINLGGGSTPGTYTTGGTFNFSGGTILATGALTFAAPLTVTGGSGAINTNGNTVTFSGAISGTGITKIGTGVLTLSGTSTSAGVITVGAGKLAVTALTNADTPGPLGAPGNVDAANLVIGGGTLGYAGPASTGTDRLLTIGPGGATLDAGSTGGMSFNATGNAVSSGTGNRTLTLAGTTTGDNLSMGLTDPASGKLTLDKEGTGRWILHASASPRTYSGDTVVNAGILLSFDDNVLPYGPGKGNLALNAGTVELNGNNLAINGLSGAGTVNNRSNSRTLTLGNGDASATFSGQLANVPLTTTSTLNLVKTGSGTQTLSGTSNYLGSTLVNGGTLAIATASAMSAASDYSVTATGTLSLAASATAESLTIVGTASSVTAAANVTLSLTGTATGPALAFNYAGSSGADAVGVPVVLTGTTPDAGGISFAAGSTATAPAWTAPIHLGSVERTFDVARGSGTTDLVITGPIGGSGNFVKVGGGNLALPAFPGTTGTIEVRAGTLTIQVAPSTTSYRPVTLPASLVVTAAGTLTFPSVDRSLGQLPAVILAAAIPTSGSGKVDLADNDLLLTATAEPAARILVSAGQLVSSYPNPLAALAVITNSDGRGGPLFPTFDGQPATAADVLVKYTYLGDADLNGRVDASDLANYFAGFTGSLHGWLNGDFNYDDHVDAADLALLMSSLQNQGASFGTSGGTGGAVPEPASLALAVPALSLLSRRRR